jgi:hypothetical protein
LEISDANLNRHNNLGSGSGEATSKGFVIGELVVGGIGAMGIPTFRLISTAELLSQRTEITD